MYKHLITAITLLVTFSTSAQNAELRNIFKEAESHYLFGEYELANPLYLILDDYLADNANIKFKIGSCYLNIPDEKTKAIPYLEQAAGNASYDANSESIRETRAPLEAYFALASAYKINYEFERALSTYARLNEMMTENQSLENAGFIDQQIKACRNAMKFVDNPIDFGSKNLGPDINRGSFNINPVLSGDGNILAFTESRGLENTIYYVKKDKGEWSQAVNITAELGGATDCSTSSLNYNGTQLYLYKNDNFTGNIYLSTYENGRWSEIKKLNRNINTRFYESHACPSSDGKRLYFTSNREGGEGGLDIYVSEKNQQGEWGEAKNLGPTINTIFNEETPFISDNDSLLFFSSEGHTNMGGYDIFKSELHKGQWQSPENMGYPLNTPDDDLFFQPVNNGKNAYYSMAEAYKKRDIFYLNIGEKQDYPVFKILGHLSLSDTLIDFNDDFRIILVSNVSGDTIDVAYPNMSSGYYSFVVKPDEYALTYQGLGYLSEKEEITIAADHPRKEEYISVTLRPDSNYIPVISAETYRMLDYSQVRIIDQIDSSILVTDVRVKDVTDSDTTDSDVLYYAVQLMALHNPVDVSFFEHADVTVAYNDEDKFYRYLTGRFTEKEQAYRRMFQLIRMGYPDDLFVKTVYREDKE
ncbi:MAG: PD40 domain-containing protein [Bacteroidales bacterium]|nr:PD40 domain-containing protein [Bacteroidales bacterium]